VCWRNDNKSYTEIRTFRQDLLTVHLTTGDVTCRHKNVMIHFKQNRANALTVRQIQFPIYTLINATRFRLAKNSVKRHADENEAFTYTIFWAVCLSGDSLRKSIKTIASFVQKILKHLSGSNVIWLPLTPRKKHCHWVVFAWFQRWIMQKIAFTRSCAFRRKNHRNICLSEKNIII
jgi:hypothetical protein